MKTVTPTSGPSRWWLVWDALQFRLGALCARLAKEPEVIVRAAIVRKGRVRHLPRPKRHAHLLWVYGSVCIERQGFVTNRGRFVNREAAAYIALQAKQIEELHWPPGLFSEDLW